MVRTYSHELSLSIFKQWQIDLLLEREWEKDIKAMSLIAESISNTELTSLLEPHFIGFDNCQRMNAIFWVKEEYYRSLN